MWFNVHTLYLGMSVTASEVGSLVTQSYAVVAGAALISFDHAITFGEEVQLFWGERSFSAWLFFANRMVALSYAIISVWSLTNIDTVTSCMTNIVASNLLIILIGIISEVVTILRVNAVTGGSRWPVMFLTLLMVFNVVANVYVSFIQVSYSVVWIKRIAICTDFYSSSSAQVTASKLDIVNGVCAAIISIMSLAILWRRLYVHHRLATVDILSTRNLSLAALLLRDGTIQLTALLLLNLVTTVMEFLGLNAANVVGYVEYSLAPVLISRVLLNVRAAARSTRGEQSQTPSFVRSQRGLEAQGNVEDMSFELNILNSTEQAQNTDRAHPQGSMGHDEIIAEPRSTADNVSTTGDAQEDVNEEEGMDEIEEEMLSDGENDV